MKQILIKSTQIHSLWAPKSEILLKCSVASQCSH